MIKPDPIPVQPAVFEARQDLIAHLLRKPRRGDSKFEVDAWNDRHAVLVAALEQATGKPATPPKQEISMAAPTKRTPEERVKSLSLSFAEAKTAKARQNLKYRIKGICKEHGLPMPDLGDGRLPKPRATVAPPKAPAPVQAPPEPLLEQAERSLEPVYQIAIDLGRSIQRHVEKSKPLDDLRASVRGIRAQIWSLLVDLERLADAERAQLVAELELMSSAAQTAVEIAQGRAA